MFETKRRALIFMLLSIGTAMIAVVLFASYIQETRASLGELDTVLVAKKKIPAGVPITADMVSEEQLPKKYMLNSLVRSPEELKGKISMVPVSEGSVLTTAMLRDNTIVSGEYRQVMLRPPMAVFDDTVDALDKVDLVMAYEASGTEAGAQGDKRMTKVLLKDITVNKVFLMKENSQDPKDIAALSVAVKLEDSKSLIWAMNYAKEIHVLKSGTAKAQSEKPAAQQLEKTDKPAPKASQPAPAPAPAP